MLSPNPTPRGALGSLILTLCRERYQPRSPSVAFDGVFSTRGGESVRWCYVELLEYEPAVGLSNPTVGLHANQKVIQIFRRSHPSPYPEVEGAGQVEAFDDPVVASRQREECLAITVVVLPDIDRGLHRPAELRVVDVGVEARDDATLDESLDPRSGCVRAQPDRAADLSLSQASVGLKAAENISVNIIDQGTIHCIRPSSATITVPLSVNSPP